ncbi:filamentous hemagglutinin N-terminal domain-containing protein, partial [Burkholderia sp. BE17]|uniref:two-partner secretion domain-containing protein n=1 Tax=Burkholderia sp. BE17 TaxID=2656644 RepID=UPI00187BBF69
MNRTIKNNRTKSSQANSQPLRIKPLVLQIAVVLLATYGGSFALAAPTGGQVAAGAASISSAGAVTTINQGSGRAVINWNSFSVGNGETVRFNAPNASSATLNRVTGTLPSNINGLVQGNGKVFLLNPNGIVVGPSGAINVQGGFVGSTGNISDSAFMQGGAMLIAGGKGNIQVLGTISTPSGDITLVAPSVAVEAGAVLKAGAQINLVAADQVTLSNGAITVTPKTGEAGNVSVAGTLQAAKVMLAAVNDNLGALAINTSGMIQAGGVSANPDGTIQITGIGSATTQIGGVLQARHSDGTGGAVQVTGHDVNVTGAQIDVSGTQGGTAKLTADTSGGTVIVDSSRISAAGAGGIGGKLDVTGWHTGLTGISTLDASGTAGGGAIRVGGDMHGQGVDIANATGTFVGSGVTLNASGTQGNASAGKVVVWADDTTNYYGHLQAHGSGSGSGGRAEVSGHNILNYDGSVDMAGGSNGGAAGSVLFDPSDLTIDAAGSGTSTGFTGAPTVPASGATFTAASSHISWQDII